MHRYVFAAIVVAAAPAHAETAEPVKSATVIVDRIAVKSGKLRDGGAGVARWAHRTLEGCVESGTVKRGSGSMRVIAGGGTEDGTLAFAGPADLRHCLEGRIGSLVWSDDVERTIIEARVIVRR